MKSPTDPAVISADSHVMEDPHLWQDRLPVRFADEAPTFPALGVGGQFQGHQGGVDPRLRPNEMAVDGVDGEVLYPSLAMNLFSLTDAALQEACFKVYNDWLVDYCAVAPKKLFGIAMISSYDIDHAVSELERCRKMGFVGAMVWEVPPPELSFVTDHYDRLWAASQSLEMPINVHSLTGVPYTWPRQGIPFDESPVAGSRHANTIINETTNLIADVICSGVLERFPRLKLVIVESEASWIPVYLSRHDHYYRRAKNKNFLPLLPSEYFERQCYVTFFSDHTLAAVLQEWGTNLCMWSSDFPHPNSSWPNSRKIIERDLVNLGDDARARILSGNVARLYKLPVLL